MDKAEIKAQKTYLTEGGLYLYVQSIEGQRVVYSHVGHTVKYAASLGRFASRIQNEVPNQ